METLYNSILSTLANYVMIPDVSSPKFALYLQSLSSDFIKLRQASNEQLTISNPDHNLQAAYLIDHYPYAVEMMFNILAQLERQGDLKAFNQTIEKSLFKTVGELNVCCFFAGATAEAIALCYYIEQYFPEEIYGKVKGVVNIHTFDRAYSDWVMSRYLTQNYLIPDFARNDYFRLIPHQLNLLETQTWEEYEKEFQECNLFIFPNILQQFEAENPDNLLDHVESLIYRLGDSLGVFVDTSPSHTTFISDLVSSLEQIPAMFSLQNPITQTLSSQLTIPEIVLESFSEFKEELMVKNEMMFHFAVVAKDEAKLYFNRGRDRYAKKDLEGAIQEFSRAIELKTNYADAYNNRGNAYQKQGNLERAIQDFSRAIELDPNHAYAYNNRGNAYQKQGNLEKAIQDYSEAIKLNINLADVYNNRGNTRQKQGKFQEAIQDYNQVIQLNPNHFHAYYSRGLAYYHQRKFDAAIEDYNQAIQLNPNQGLPYNLRGNARQKKGDLDGAIEDYNRAIKINPNQALSYKNRGQARSEKGDLDGAIEDFQEAIRLNPNYAKSSSI